MNLQQVLAMRFEPIEHLVTARDCMLYALGIGVDDRPGHAADLQFCYEDHLAVFPSSVNIVAYPGVWVAKPGGTTSDARAMHSVPHRAPDGGVSLKTVTEYWRSDGAVSFRATVAEREVMVLNSGYAEAC